MLPGAAEEAAPQVRAAIARAARAGLPPARQREAAARLRQRDAAAAENLCSCASATPFSLAAYKDALNTAARFELGERYHELTLQASLDMHSMAYIMTGLSSRAWRANSSAHWHIYCTHALCS